MSVERYEIKITGITQNGVPCTNPEITWENPSCGAINCVLENGTTLKVEIPEGCDECFYVNISCPSDCDSCPPVRKKICLCDGPDDCAACETCVSGICVEDCPGKPCTNGECKDCDENNPCTGGRVCKEGTCECPPSKPFVDSKGVCRSCLEDSQCPPCHVCTPDGCKPVVCPEGFCDENTGECEECTRSEHCPDNEVCKNLRCECEEGFERDFETGKCIPSPECLREEDCGECEQCVQGVCVPKECPDGFVCVGGDCLPECDCNSGGCNEGSTCTRLNSTTCYCKPCGECSEGCAEGCICVDGDCKDNPCSGSCENGADCGPGCGCLDGQCVPCSSLNCSNQECAQALGCECSGTNCIGVPDCPTGDCVTSDDCGEGCTCYKGSCVNCSNFPCSDGACSDQDGCACSDSGCAGDGNDGCQDRFNLIIGNEDCALTAELTKGNDSGCACPRITTEAYISDFRKDGVSAYFDFEVKLRKGTALSRLSAQDLPTLDDQSNPNIADNETPISGLASLEVDITYKEYDEEGRFTGFSTDDAVSTLSYSLINTATAVFSNVTLLELGTRTGLGNRREVYRYSFRISTSNLKFPNRCEYPDKNVLALNIKSFENIDQRVSDLQTLGGVVVNTTPMTRLPLFKWFKSKTGVFGSTEAFRKVYVLPSGAGIYKDTLYGPGDIPSGRSELLPPEGELYAGYSYLVTNDCSCDKEEQINNLCFDNPDTLNFNVLDCGKSIEVLPPFNPCLVNSDLSMFPSAPADAQTTYELLLNGQSQGVFQQVGSTMLDTGGSSLFRVYSLGNQTPITSVALRQNHGGGKCDFIEVISPPENVDPDYAVDCSLVGSTVTVVVPEIQGSRQVTSVTASTGQSATSAPFSIAVQKGQPVQIVVEYLDGCTGSFEVNENCCESLKGGITQSGAGCNATTTSLSAVPQGGEFPYSFEWQGPNGPLGVGSVSNITVQLPEDAGAYSVLVRDAQGCEATFTTQVVVNDTPEVLISAPPVLCNGQTTDVTITVSNAPNALINFEVNGVPSSATLAGSTHTINNVAPGSQIIVTSVVHGSCTYNFNKTELVRAGDSVNLSLSLSSTDICSGAPLTVRVSGTPNANYILYQGDPNNGGQIASANVVGTIGYTDVTLFPSESATYFITTPGNPECGVTLGPPVSVNVLDSAGANIILSPQGAQTVCETASPYNFTVSNTANQPASYLVEFSSSVNGVTQNTIVSNATGGANIPVTGVGGETVTVTIISADINTCTTASSVSSSVVFESPSTFDITSNTSTICAGDTVSITVTSTGAGSVSLTPAPAGSTGVLTFPASGGSQVVNYTQTGTISYSIVSTGACPANYTNQSVVVSLDPSTTPGPTSTPCLANSNIRRFNFGVQLASVQATTSANTQVNIPISASGDSFELDTNLYNSVEVLATGSSCPVILPVSPCIIEGDDDNPTESTYTVTSQCHTPNSFVSSQAESYVFEAQIYNQDTAQITTEVFTIPYNNQSMTTIVQTFAQLFVAQGFATGFTVTPGDGSDCPVASEGGFSGRVVFTGVPQNSVVTSVLEYYTLPASPSTQANPRTRSYSVTNTQNSN